MKPRLQAAVRLPRFAELFLIFAAGLLIAIVLHSRWSERWLGRFNVSIVEFRNATGHADTKGVVTYVDPEGKRLWIQDETGALLLNWSGANVVCGQLVRVQADIAQVPGSASTPAPRLTKVRVFPTSDYRPLPTPQLLSPRESVQKELGGLRVQLSGVVHSVSKDSRGRILVAFGDSVAEFTAVLPNSLRELPVNASVLVTGVGESIRDKTGYLGEQRVWVQNAADIRVISQEPLLEPLQSVRSLWTQPGARDGHRIRLILRVKAQIDSKTLLLQDRWGAVAASFDDAQVVKPNSVVDLSGFPHVRGPRIQIEHAVVKVLPTGKLPPDGYSGHSLTSTAAIHELSEGRANTALPVRIEGTVTFVDDDWGLLFVQDRSGGIFVSYSRSGVQLFPGQRVTVIGVTNAGQYAPIVAAADFIPRGLAKLPTPVDMTSQQASSGVLDSVFVQVKGVVHSIPANQAPKHLNFTLYSSFGPIHVATPLNLDFLEQLKKMEDATVRIRGVCGTIFNSRRQLVGFQLFVSSLNNVAVIDPPDERPFEQPPTLVRELLQFSPHARFNHRVRVVGTVTMVGPGFLYLQDDTGGVRVGGDIHDVPLGGAVEALGYASSGGYSPVLTEARVRLLEKGFQKTITPVPIGWSANSNYDSRLVTIDGRVLSIMTSAQRKTIVLDSGGLVLDATLYAESLAGTPSPSFEVGSVVRLTGICSSRLDPESSYLLNQYSEPGFELLIRSPGDIRVLRRSSWWTLVHTLAVIALLTAIIMVGLVWLAVLRKRMLLQNARLQRALERDKAVHDLASAMQEVTLRKDFSARVSVTTDRDIALLGAEFNNMITELHSRDLAQAAAEAKLQKQALTDELTGLPNRRLLADRLGQTLESARRDQQIIALLYLDLDGFKLVNDSLGHSVGDVLLAQVAERLRSRIRKADTLARLGGDEFAVVLTKLHRKDEAGLVAQTLLEVLSSPFLIEKHEITISCSIGISMFPENAVDGALLLQQADSAMYSAKRNGKNKMMYFTPELGSQVRERLNLENQLRGAISRGEIAVHYQPEFEIATRRLVRFEALARWTHATLGEIPPDRFIPVAEESGLIIPLGAYILERACTDAVAWQSLSEDPVQVAVNVSSVQFARPGFVEEVGQVLRDTGLAPQLLQIELTESVMLHGVASAAESMRRLRKLGVSIAIDDFGTGYSCFGYLPRLPFNALKIDRAFVNELSTRSEMKAMVHSLVTLAHNLDMQVIVEGVETPEQLRIIKALGGNQVQGFLLGRPTADPRSHLACKKVVQDKDSFAQDGGSVPGKKPARSLPEDGSGDGDPARLKIGS